jgi:uncharacterized protein
MDLPEIGRSYRDLARYYVERWKEGRPFCLWDIDDAIVQLAAGRPRRSRCGAGVTTAAVTAEGELYACHMSTGLPGAALGTMESGFDMDRRRAWEERYLYGRKGCEGCWARALCGGGCNTHALSYNGSLSEPYRLECELIRLRYRLAFWILSELPEIRGYLSGPAAEGGSDSGHLLTPLWSLIEDREGLAARPETAP